METIIETDNITLDFDESRPLSCNGEFRISLYDKYGHYEDTFYISKLQMRDLIEAMKDRPIIIKEFF